MKDAFGIMPVGFCADNFLFSRLLGRLGVALGALVLASCGTEHSALRLSEKPRHYRDVATSKRMPSSIAQIYDTGPKIKRRMIELIEGATDYILIGSFLVVNAPETREVMEALKRRHREGVRIYILADAASRWVPYGKSPFRDLKKAKIPTVEFNPLRLHQLIIVPLLLPRDHRKFWIVDGKILFLGGANIFPTSLRAAENRGNIDFMVAIESREAVATMIDSFVASWNASSRLKLNRNAFAIRARGEQPGTLWICDQNEDVGREEMIGKMFEGLFAVAKKEIWLIQPYTYTNSHIIGQIRALTARGVEVNLMLSEQVHAPQFHLASTYGIKDILQAGGKVWTIRRPYGALHAKAVIVDGRWATIGSANFNARSYHLSKEVNLIFDDHRSVEEVQRAVDKLKKRCRPIGMEEAKLYRSLKYFLAWKLMQLAG